VESGWKARGQIAVGFVAKEFVPLRDPLDSLAKGVAICTV
jgi:hypothetical protein